MSRDRKKIITTTISVISNYVTPFKAERKGKNQPFNDAFVVNENRQNDDDADDPSILYKRKRERERE